MLEFTEALSQWNRSRSRNFSPNFLNRVPDEVIIHIMTQTDPITVTLFGSTCKRIYSISNSRDLDDYWIQHYVKRTGLTFPEVSRLGHVKPFYKQRMVWESVLSRGFFTKIFKKHYYSLVQILEGVKIHEHLQSLKCAEDRVIISLLEKAGAIHFLVCTLNHPSITPNESILCLLLLERMFNLIIVKSNISQLTGFISVVMSFPLESSKPLAVALRILDLVCLTPNVTSNLIELHMIPFLLNLGNNYLDTSIKVNVQIQHSILGIFYQILPSEMGLEEFESELGIQWLFLLIRLQPTEELVQQRAFELLYLFRHSESILEVIGNNLDQLQITVLNFPKSIILFTAIFLQLIYHINKKDKANCKGAVHMLYCQCSEHRVSLCNLLLSFSDNPHSPAENEAFAYVINVLSYPGTSSLIPASDFVCILNNLINFKNLKKRVIFLIVDALGQLGSQAEKWKELNEIESINSQNDLYSLLSALTDLRNSYRDYHPISFWMEWAIQNVLQEDFMGPAYLWMYTPLLKHYEGHIRNDTATLQTAIIKYPNTAGMWMYEVQVISGPGPLIVGYGKDPDFRDTSKVLQPHVYYADLRNYTSNDYKLISQLEIIPLSIKWKVGDFIQCGLNLTDRKVIFSLNGTPMGSGLKVAWDSRTIFPIITIGCNVELKVNLGEIPFQFPLTTEYGNFKPILGNPYSNLVGGLMAHVNTLEQQCAEQVVKIIDLTTEINILKRRF